ncbi:MAG: hypothetical protein FJ096_18195, partial [Deltaproteobacteria bacterium]|nr:hypothetical protein [Deltaproteobacteria bacterium]
MKTSLTRIQGGRALALVALALHAPACDDTTGARSSSSAAPTSAPLPAPFGSVWNGLTARSSSPAAPSPAPRPPAIATASSSATDAAAPLASSSASSSPAASAPLGVDTAPLAEPLLREPSGKLLPQTEEKPSLESPIFKRHVASLVRAIEVDDVELARSFFFPVDAYEVVKGIKEPAKDWNRRLFKAFKRDVHEYHRQLKGDAAGS